MSDNAMLENLAKLARLITMGQPLRGQAVGEAIDLCVIEWRNDKARIEGLERELAKLQPPSTLDRMIDEGHIDDSPNDY